MVVASVDIIVVEIGCRQRGQRTSCRLGAKEHGGLDQGHGDVVLIPDGKRGRLLVAIGTQMRFDRRWRRQAAQTPTADAGSKRGQRLGVGEPPGTADDCGLVWTQGWEDQIWVGPRRAPKDVFALPYPWAEAATSEIGPDDGSISYRCLDAGSHRFIQDISDGVERALEALKLVFGRFDELAS